MTIDRRHGVTLASRRVRFGIAFSIVAITSCTSLLAAADDIARSGGPYVPTPQAVVDEMLTMARVGPDDFVIDLGSGDGRIVLTAASRYRARGMGVDIDGELVDLSNAEAKRQGVDKLVKFHRQDVLQTRISDATVITLYLLPELMHSLRDRIYSQLKPGARVVSHDFSFIEWLPDRKVTLDVTEKYHMPGPWQSTVYLWVVPAKVGGSWRAAVSGPAGEDIIFSFTQKFQELDGHAVHGGERMMLQDGQLQGNKIRFRLPGMAVGRSALRAFEGTVEGDTMNGQVVSQHGTTSWTAKRFDTPAQPQR